MPETLTFETSQPDRRRWGVTHKALRFFRSELVRALVELGLCVFVSQEAADGFREAVHLTDLVLGGARAGRKLLAPRRARRALPPPKDDEQP